MSVRTALYQFVVSCTALYPLAYVLAHTSTYHLVPPCTRGTGFQMAAGKRLRDSEDGGEWNSNSSCQTEGMQLTQFLLWAMSRRWRRKEVWK